MNVKQLFSTSTTICLICAAVLMSQTLFTGNANARSASGGNNENNLRQRVTDLEQMQDEDDKEFFLIDTSLSDLDFRVIDLEKRAGARMARIKAIEKRAEGRTNTINANHRSTMRCIKRIRTRLSALEGK